MPRLRKKKKAEEKAPPLTTFQQLQRSAQLDRERLAAAGAGDHSEKLNKPQWWEKIIGVVNTKDAYLMASARNAINLVDRVAHGKNPEMLIYSEPIKGGGFGKEGQEQMRRLQEAAGYFNPSDAGKQSFKGDLGNEGDFTKEVQKRNPEWAAAHPTATAAIGFAGNLGLSLGTGGGGSSGYSNATGEGAEKIMAAFGNKAVTSGKLAELGLDAVELAAKYGDDTTDAGRALQRVADGGEAMMAELPDAVSKPISHAAHARAGEALAGTAREWKVPFLRQTDKGVRLGAEIPKLTWTTAKQAEETGGKGLMYGRKALGAAKDDTAKAVGGAFPEWMPGAVRKADTGGIKMYGETVVPMQKVFDEASFGANKLLRQSEKARSVLRLFSPTERMAQLHEGYNPVILANAKSASRAYQAAAGTAQLDSVRAYEDVTEFGLDGKPVPEKAKHDLFHAIPEAYTPEQRKQLVEVQHALRRKEAEAEALGSTLGDTSWATDLSQARLGESQDELVRASQGRGEDVIDHLKSVMRRTDLEGNSTAVGLNPGARVAQGRALPTEMGEYRDAGFRVVRNGGISEEEALVNLREAFPGQYDAVQTPDDLWSAVSDARAYRSRATADVGAANSAVREAKATSGTHQRVYAEAWFDTDGVEAELADRAARAATPEDKQLWEAASNRFTEWRRIHALEIEKWQADTAAILDRPLREAARKMPVPEGSKVLFEADGIPYEWDYNGVGIGRYTPEGLPSRGEPGSTFRVWTQEGDFTDGFATIDDAARHIDGAKGQGVAGAPEAAAPVAAIPLADVKEPVDWKIRRIQFTSEMEDAARRDLARAAKATDPAEAEKFRGFAAHRRRMIDDAQNDTGWLYHSSDVNPQDMVASGGISPMRGMNGLSAGSEVEKTSYRAYPVGAHAYGENEYRVRMGALIDSDEAAKHPDASEIVLKVPAPMEHTEYFDNNIGEWRPLSEVAAPAPLSAADDFLQGSTQAGARAATPEPPPLTDSTRIDADAQNSLLDAFEPRPNTAEDVARVMRERRDVLKENPLPKTRDLLLAKRAALAEDYDYKRVTEWLVKERGYDEAEAKALTNLAIEFKRANEALNRARRVAGLDAPDFLGQGGAAGYVPHMLPAKPSVSDVLRTKAGNILRDTDNKTAQEIGERIRPKHQSVGDDVMREVGYDPDALEFPLGPSASQAKGSVRPSASSAREHLFAENRIGSGLATETDAVMVESIKRNKERVNVAQAKYEDGFVRLYGKPLKDGMDAPRNFEVHSVTRHGKTTRYAVPQQAEEWYSSVNRRLVTDPDVGSFLRSVDAANNFWKKMATSWRVAFHGANYANNAFQSWFQGTFDEESFRIANEIQFEKWLGIGEPFGKTGQMITAGGETKSAAAWIEELREMRVHKEMFGPLENQMVMRNEAARRALTQARDEFFQGKANYKSAQAWKDMAAGTLNPTVIGNDLGTGIEDMWRGQVYFNMINKGYDKDVAAQMVDRVLYDYSQESLTAFEREGIKRWVNPFYTYVRRSVPSLTEAAVKNPGKVAVLGKINQGAFAASGMEHEDLPGYERALGTMPIPGLQEKDLPFGGDSERQIMLRPSRLLGLFDVVQRLEPNLAEQEKTFASGLPPVLRLPIELGANKSFFTGRQIRKFEGDKEEINPAASSLDRLLQGNPAWEQVKKVLHVKTLTEDDGTTVLATNARAAYAIQQASVWLNEFGAFFGDAEGYENAGRASGVRLLPYDQEKFELSKAYDEEQVLDDAVKEQREAGVLPTYEQELAAKRELTNAERVKKKRRR